MAIYREIDVQPGRKQRGGGPWSPWVDAPRLPIDPLPPFDASKIEDKDFAEYSRQPAGRWSSRSFSRHFYSAGGSTCCGPGSTPVPPLLPTIPTWGAKDMPFFLPLRLRPRHLRKVETVWTPEIKQCSKQSSKQWVMEELIPQSLLRRRGGT